MMKCFICDKEITDKREMNNAEPLVSPSDERCCCDECNNAYVKPARRVLWHIDKEEYNELAPHVWKMSIEEIKSALADRDPLFKFKYSFLIEKHAKEYFQNNRPIVLFPGEGTFDTELVKRYGKPYIRFYAGAHAEMPYEFPISEDECAAVLENPEFRYDLVKQAKTRTEWTRDAFVKICIMEYLYHCTDPRDAESTYYHMAPAQKMRFYRIILGDALENKVLLKEDGLLLVNQYGLKYILYDGGEIAQSILPCLITEEETANIQKREVTMGSVVNFHQNHDNCTAAELRESLIKAYLRTVVSYSEQRLDKAIEKLKNHGDIYFEFYDYILDGAFSPDGLAVEGYTAAKLVAKYPLSPLGAYNYLIYLREDPKEALANLAAGLPNKDVIAPVKQ